MLAVTPCKFSVTIYQGAKMKNDRVEMAGVVSHV